MTWWQKAGDALGTVLFALVAVALVSLMAAGTVASLKVLYTSLRWAWQP